MAVPVLESTTLTVETSATSGQTVNMPATRPDTDKYYALMAVAGITSVGVPSGSDWVLINSELHDSNSNKLWIFGLNTSGTIDGSFLFPNVTATKSASAVLRISGGEFTADAIGVDEASDSNDATSPNVVVNVDDTLVIRWGSRFVNNTNDYITGTPSTFIAVTNTSAASSDISIGLSQENGPASGNGTGTAAFTDAGGFSQWMGWTIAFAPSTGGGGPTSVSASAASVLPTIITDATAAETFLSDTIQTIPTINQSITALELFDSGIAQTLPNVTQNATVQEAFSSDLTQTLPNVTQSSIGLLVPEGIVNQTLANPIQSIAASARAQIYGNVVQTFPYATQLHSGVLEFIANSVQTLPNTSQSVNGITGAISGTATATLPTIIQTLNCTESFVGTATQNITLINMQVNASIGYLSQGISTLPNITQTNTVIQEFPTTSTQELPFIAQSALGTMTIPVAGTCYQLFPTLQQEVICSTVTLPDYRFGVGTKYVSLDKHVYKMF